MSSIVTAQCTRQKKVQAKKTHTNASNFFEQLINKPGMIANQRSNRNMHMLNEAFVVPLLFTRNQTSKSRIYKFFQTVEVEIYKSVRDRGNLYILRLVDEATFWHTDWLTQYYRTQSFFFLSHCAIKTMVYQRNKTFRTKAKCSHTIPQRLSFTYHEWGDESNNDNLTDTPKLVGFKVVIIYQAHPLRVTVKYSRHSTRVAANMEARTGSSLQIQMQLLEDYHSVYSQHHVSSRVRTYVIYKQQRLFDQTPQHKISLSLLCRFCIKKAIPQFNCVAE